MPGRHLVLNTVNGHSRPVHASGGIPAQDHVANYEPISSVRVDLDPPSPLPGSVSEPELALAHDNASADPDSDDDEQDPFNDGATCLSTCAAFPPGVVVVGTRNGHVLTWDTRQQSSLNRVPLFHMDNRGKPQVAVAAGGVRCLTDLSAPHGIGAGQPVLASGSSSGQVGRGRRWGGEGRMAAKDGQHAGDKGGDVVVTVGRRGGLGGGLRAAENDRAGLPAPDHYVRQ